MAAGYSWLTNEAPEAAIIRSRQSHSLNRSTGDIGQVIPHVTHNACNPYPSRSKPALRHGQASMDDTSAERQRRYRERRQQNHRALLDKLTERQTELDAALKRERDELAERLARIVAFAPATEAEAA